MRTRGKHSTSLRRALGVIAVIALVATACDPGKVTPTAGTGTSGSTGDGGPATAATFQEPGGIVAIPGGGYYVVDDQACVIRKVDASGTITTVAGNGTCGYSGDGGPATSAEINPALQIVPYGGSPASLPTNSEAGQAALDSVGNLYLVDTANNRLRKIGTSGTITTVATESNMNGLYVTGQVVPATVAITPDDTVYLTEGQAVNKVLENGTLEQIYKADDQVHAIAPTPDGDLYLSVTGAGGTDEIVLLQPDGTATPSRDVDSAGHQPGGRSRRHPLRRPRSAGARHHRVLPLRQLRSIERQPDRAVRPGHRDADRRRRQP